MKLNYFRKIGLSKPKLALLATIIILAAVQFGVPGNRIMPRTSIGSMPVGWKTDQAVTDTLVKNSQKLSLQFGDKKVSLDSQKVGITTNVEETIEQAPVITLRDRLIPLMPVVKLLQKKEVKLVVDRDERKIKAYALKASAELRSEPVNASSEIKDGSLIINKDKPGLEYDADQIQRQLESLDPLKTEPLVFKAKSIPAEIKEADVAPLKQDFAKKTAASLTVTYGITTKTIEPVELKKWLKVQQNPETKQYSIVMNDEVVDAQMQAWAKEYNISPGITQIAYKDDIEVSRNVGESGRALDTDTIRQQLNDWFVAPSAQPITLASEVLAPTIVASRTYSRSSAQLQAQINAWVASNNGRYQIAIRELNGKGREASYNVAQQTVMASTYKPFLAFVAYKQAESGALNLSSTFYAGGPTVERCIEIMIINSDNECAVKLGKYIGWAKVDQVIAASGFEGIVLNNYDSNGNLKGDKLVNAREQAKFLAQLSGGSLMNQANSARLIDYMKRQAYSRAGIPAGSRDAPVANKVGVLDNYLHDVAIVYGPKSTYALVIMSQGSNWSNIKNLSQAVYDFMNE